PRRPSARAVLRNPDERRLRPQARRHDGGARSEEHTSELQSPYDLVCRLLLEKKKKTNHRRDKRRDEATQHTPNCPPRSETLPTSQLTVPSQRHPLARNYKTHHTQQTTPTSRQ